MGHTDCIACAGLGGRGIHSGFVLCTHCGGSGVESGPSQTVAPDRAALIAWVKAQADEWRTETSNVNASDFVDHFDAIAAFLEAEAWQPIATAPKPDAKVLGWCPYRHIKDPDFRVAVMWWREKYKRWCSAENDSFVTDEEDGPTHWRPLPAPPVTEAP